MLLMSTRAYLFFCNCFPNGLTSKEEMLSLFPSCQLADQTKNTQVLLCFIHKSQCIVFCISSRHLMYLKHFTLRQQLMCPVLSHLCLQFSDNRLRAFFCRVL